MRDYGINNSGATTSLANIQSDLESKQGVIIKREMLGRYLQILEESKVVSKCACLDMKPRKSLRGEQKYYLADLSVYFALNTDSRTNSGPSSRTSFIATLAHKVARSASDASVSSSATSSSGTTRWVLHTSKSR